MLMWKYWKTFLCLVLMMTLLHSPYGSWAMDGEEGDIKRQQTITKKDSSSDSSYEQDEDNENDLAIDIETSSLSTLPSLAELPDHSAKKAINDLLLTIADKQTKLFRADSSPFESSIAIYYPYSVSAHWNDPVLFLKDLDEKFFLQPISKKTRFLQGVGALVTGAAPWAMGPLVLYLGENILGFLPVDGPTVYGIVIPIIGVITPPCMLQGWEAGGELGNRLFDKHGLTPSKSDKKAHIYPESYPLLSRTLSFGGAVIRALPFSLLFWEAEQYFNPYRLTFIGPFSVSLLKRTYDDSMAFWERFSYKRQTEINHMESERKKILLNSLEKMKKIINASGSNKFVNLLYKEMHKAIGVVKANAAVRTRFMNDVKTSLLSNNVHKLQEAIEGYIDHALGTIPITDMDKGVLFSNIKRKISRYNDKLLLKVSKTFHNHDEESLIQDKDSLVPHLQLTENNSNALIQEIYEYLQQRIGKIKLQNKTASNKGIPITPSLSEEETCVSAFSLLFLKYQPLDSFKEVKQQLLDAYRKIARPHKPAGLRHRKKAQENDSRAEQDSGTETVDGSKSSIDLTELKMAVEDVNDVPIDKMAALISGLDKLPPKPPTRGLLENAAIHSQGTASLGRFLITQWAMQRILMYAGAREDIAFAIGIGTATVDVVCRSLQEWYLQQDTFASIRNVGRRSNDFWPLRWFTHATSAVSSAFFTLPTVGILFNVFSESPFYIKLLVTIATCPSDYASFFHFLHEKWSTLIRNGTTSCIHTTAQKRAWLNEQVDRAKKTVLQLDQGSTDELSTLTQGTW